MDGEPAKRHENLAKFRERVFVQSSSPLAGFPFPSTAYSLKSWSASLLPLSSSLRLCVKPSV